MSDPITFIFLITMWHTDTHVPSVWVQADNLDGATCIAMMEEYHKRDPLHDGGIPSCEINVGIKMEDVDDI